MTVELVSIEAVRPSTYNPRTADPYRLDLIELSLRKLGWLLPIYADRNGEILSGHQRHYVANRMRLEKVPVFYTPPMDLEQRKAINIAFNRGTNDLTHASTTKTMLRELQQVDAFKVGESLPTVDPQNEKAFYGCLYPKRFSLKDLIAKNRGRWKAYSFQMAKMLAGVGITMPIICLEDGTIINGIGRLQYMAEKKEEFAFVVVISQEQAQFSDTMLNSLSMDFDLHNRYRETLRYNSFRRARRVRSELGLGFLFVVAPNTRASHFDVNLPRNAEKWKRTHGTRILDFGAGHLHEAKILQSIGVDVTPFEPYRLGEKDTINKTESLQIALRFLEAIERGKEFNSIFISSVLNSVPFEEDRSHIATLCSAVCSERTRLYALAGSTNSMNLKQVKGYDSLNERQSRALIFLLDYEKNITLGDFKSKPKVQKYHTKEEFYNLFKPFFKKVQVKESLDNVHALCAEPLPIHPQKLRKAIEFEFELPYPDGSTMGLSKRAIKAFETRLGVTL